MLIEIILKTSHHNNRRTTWKSLFINRWPNWNMQRKWMRFIFLLLLLLFLHCMQCCIVHTPALTRYGNWVNSLTQHQEQSPIQAFGRLYRCVNLTRLKYERVLFDWDSGAMITYLHMIYFDKSSSFFASLCMCW